MEQKAYQAPYTLFSFIAVFTDPATGPAKGKPMQELHTMYLGFIRCLTEYREKGK